MLYTRRQHRHYSGVQAEGWRSPGWRLRRVRMSFEMVVRPLLASVDLDIMPPTHIKVVVTLGQVCKQGKVVNAACNSAGVQAEG